MSQQLSNNKGNKNEEESNISPYLVSTIQSTIQPKIVSTIQPKFLTSLDHDQEVQDGTKLPEEVKTKMETSFNHDFSNVKIHTDSDKAKNIGAKAYAQGNAIHFAPGAYDPQSKEGQELLGHELTHVVQQGQGKVKSGDIHGKGLNININPSLEKEADEMGKLASEGKDVNVSGNSNQDSLQAYFSPEDASDEMVGREFTLRNSFLIPGTTITLPAGTSIQITQWINTSPEVSASTTVAGKTISFKQPKENLKTVSSTPGLDPYTANAGSQASTVTKGKKAVAAHEAREPEFLKAKNATGYVAELTRLQTTAQKQMEELNRRLIQETMFNSLDVSIKKWTSFYDNSIGSSKGWSPLDPNLIKSMIYQESQMGTSGQFIKTDPKETVMNRFNVMQSIDSSGNELYIMMKEMDPVLAQKYKLDQINTDLYSDKAKRETLVAKGKLNASEQAELAAIDARVKEGTRISWDWYYWTDVNFNNAWNEFRTKTTVHRDQSYDFWIQTAVRWMFEKRKNVSSWPEAVRAYNGSGSRAERYRDHVVNRKNAAAAAHKSNTPFKPSL